MHTVRLYHRRHPVPEAGSERDYKLFLLRPGWRVCTHCHLRRRKPGLKLVIDQTGVHWLCQECRRKLIFINWSAEWEQDLHCVYNARAERVLFETLSLAQAAALTPEAVVQMQANVWRPAQYEPGRAQ